MKRFRDQGLIRFLNLKIEGVLRVRVQYQDFRAAG